MVAINGGWQPADSDAVVLEWIRQGLIGPQTPIRHSSWPNPMPLAHVPQFAHMLGAGAVFVATPSRKAPASMDPKIKALLWGLGMLFVFGTIRAAAVAAVVVGVLAVLLGLLVVGVAVGAKVLAAPPAIVKRVGEVLVGRPFLLGGWVAAVALGGIFGIGLRSSRIAECEQATAFFVSMDGNQTLPQEEAKKKLAEWKSRATSGRAACSLVGMATEMAALEAAEAEVGRQQAAASEVERQEAARRRQAAEPGTGGTPTGAATPTSTQQAPGSDLVGPRGEVSAIQFGDDWPLRVPAGRIICHVPSMVFFQAPGGPLYAVNGSAGGCVNNDNPGCSGLRPKEIEPIWLDDLKVGHGLKKSIGPLIQAGLTFCNKQGK